MLFVLAIFFAIAWALGFVVFHVSTATIHLLIVLAVVCAVISLLQRRRTV
jgi:Family of unknown function (DUF5670)